MDDEEKEDEELCCWFVVDHTRNNVRSGVVVSECVCWRTIPRAGWFGWLVDSFVGSVFPPKRNKVYDSTISTQALSN